MKNMLGIENERLNFFIKILKLIIFIFAELGFKNKTKIYSSILKNNLYLFFNKLFIFLDKNKNIINLMSNV